MPFPIEARFMGEGGWDGEAERAAEHLTAGEVYTVLRLDVGRSSSLLTLQDFPDLSFNTVMFAGVSRIYGEDGDELPPPRDRWQALKNWLDDYAAEVNQNADQIAVAEHVREHMDELEER